jgi:transcriptional regulator with XRE-family HTH domain
MDITTELTDPAVLAEMGERILRRRLEAGLTQAALATAAGLGKRTVERLEAGKGSDLVSFIKVLRALGVVQNLEAVLPAEAVRPMELLELRGRERKRVRPSRTAVEVKQEPWTWGEG